jgi:uncharacterized protein (TIGR03067 family)
MISRTIACLSLVLSLGIASAGDAAKKDKDKLNGSWQSTEIVNGGNKSDLEVTLKFDGDKVTVTIKDKDAITGTYSIDPSKTPATIDLNLEKDGNALKVLAIYEVKGDELKICHTQGEGSDRPTSFEATEKTALATLKRQKQ